MGLRSYLVRRFWDSTHRRGLPTTWLDDRYVVRHVRRRITGSPDVATMDGFASLGLGPFERALSLGCGSGALERDVVRRRLVGRIVGVDASPAALDLARRAAAAEGLRGIDYRRADLNRFELGGGDLAGPFDAVFFHQALHHVSALERCLDVVRQHLRPGGILFVDEYVGPSRREWNDSNIAPVRRAFARVPSAVRRVRRVALPVDRRDPSEAVRSSEIPAALRERFETVVERPYGGNLLAPLLPNLELDRLPESEHEAWIDRWVAEEDDRLTRGEPTYYLAAVYRRPNA